MNRLNATHLFYPKGPYCWAYVSDQELLCHPSVTASRIRHKPGIAHPCDWTISEACTTHSGILSSCYAPLTSLLLQFHTGNDSPIATSQFALVSSQSRVDSTSLLLPSFASKSTALFAYNESCDSPAAAVRSVFWSSLSLLLLHLRLPFQVLFELTHGIVIRFHPHFSIGKISSLHEFLKRRKFLSWWSLSLSSYLLFQSILMNGCNNGTHKGECKKEINLPYMLLRFFKRPVDCSKGLINVLKYAIQIEINNDKHAMFVGNVIINFGTDIALMVDSVVLASHSP